MKKLYTFALGLLLAGFTFPAMAEGLGTAKITEPTGQYISSPSVIIVQWFDDENQPVTISLADAKEGTDVEENTYQYVTVYATVGDGEKTAVEATLYGGAAGGETLEEGKGVGLKIAVNEVPPFYAETQGIFGPYMALVPGEWTIEIPEGVVENEDETQNTSEEFSLKVYGTSGADPIVEPELYSSGGVEDVMSYSPTDLNEVTFSWEMNVKLIGKITITKQVLDNEGTMYVDAEDSTAENLEVTATADGNGFTADLSEYEEGVYKITIPEGALIFDDNLLLSTDLNYYVKIFSGMATGEVVYPESSFASNFSNVMFSWGGAEITFVNTENKNVTIELPNYESIKVEATLEYSQAGEGPNEPNQDPGDGPVVDPQADEADVYNVLVVDMSSVIEEYGYGRYYIKVPEGLVQNSDRQINPAQTYDMAVYPISEEKAVITVTEDNNLLVSFTGYEAIESTYANSIQIKDADGEIVTEPFIWFMSNDDFTALTTTIYTSELEDGEYQLVIPEANLMLITPNYEYTYLNAEQTFEFQIENGVVSPVEDETDTDAVGSLVNEAVVEGVYNMQGVKVGNDLNGLAKGLYIVNGKKVIVR